ncbi:class I SAM-dependent methyltransferase [Oceanomicrobium pacificus]|uniref:Class I SAM-dependent methyltransferase n=1 Tax=Oceanomicrobium pacificus TaxID=2692916 RepID=A0A6B0TUV0_9RHOB|nr:class I SAM-dependent methyltransferase [Oceanomicrobium pacificus]MXU65012.1 class I SAM-dependent methyltransferase [Oceanomicrobium pacificus]
MTDSLSDYISRDLRKVDGWLTAFDARLIVEILNWQLANGVVGCLGEIGVHHGKLLILLQLAARADESVFGVDLFENQSENVDRSGRGDRDALMRNADRFGSGSEALVIMKRNSLKLEWPEIEKATQSDCRFFSVDGGHTTEITKNDLMIADQSLASEGVICLDDYFNKSFPEVSIGLCQFMSDANLAPFGISENKVFLCRPELQKAYSDCLRGAVREAEHASDVDFFGYATPVLQKPRVAYERIKTSRLARQLQDTELGESLKPLVRRLFARS